MPRADFKAENKQKKEKLAKLAEDNASVLFDGNFDLIMIVNSADEKLQFAYVSPFFESLRFYQGKKDNLSGLIADFTNEMVVPEESETFVDIMQISKLLPVIERNEEMVCTAHLDTPYGVQAEKIVVRFLKEDDGKNRQLLLTFSNIADIMNHDWMTDEFSRSGFIAEAGRIIRRDPVNGKYSIVYTNIPGLKAINDLFGTFTGDMIIFKVRDILLETFQPTVLARLEADHFAVLTETKFINENALLKLNHTNYSNGSIQYQFQIHCGIYNISDATEEVVHMLDYAQLVEKTISAEVGRPYATFDEEMRIRYLEQRMLVSELDKALENNDIIPYYQPVVDIKTKKIVSAEALVRWHHPKLGMISPGKFVPAFEESGQISKVDHQMLHHVLDFNRKRKEQGLPVVPCAVNLSRVDFYDSIVTSYIKGFLYEYEDLPEFLKLEVTESAYMELENVALDFLTEIQKRGISILLDDYGSGMSSLSTLEQFPFNILKIDMGFVRKIGKSVKAEAIIKSTIEMAHGLDAKVVAEGVEEEAQFKFLEEWGCDYIQGFYFYKPMPEEEFAALLKE